MTTVDVSAVSSSIDDEATKAQGVSVTCLRLLTSFFAESGLKSKLAFYFPFCGSSILN